MAEPLESTTTTATTFADDFLADFEPGLSPAEEEGEEEEELEWMKSFPPLETFVAPPPTPPAEAAAPAAARSHVSVLTLAPLMKLPARARSKIRRRKRKIFYNVPVAAEISVPVPVAEEKGKGRRKCLHCESETTPQWRTGPMGPKTLCNACGVRYKSGRLVPEYRPANSPTFSAALHSNSHRRIMEMRRRTTGRGRPRVVIL